MTLLGNLFGRSSLPSDQPAAQGPGKAGPKRRSSTSEPLDSLSSPSPQGPAARARHPSYNTQALSSIPKLAPPTGRGRTSPLGKRYKIDKFVDYRRNVRHLRRLFEEGALGGDAERAAAFAVHQFEALESGPLTESLEKAARKGVLNTTAAPRVTSLAASLGLAPLEALRDGEKDLLGHVSVVATYWNQLNEDLDNVESLLARVFERGAIPADVVATPEVKRMVRVLGNDAALLQKDLAAFKYVAGGYAAGLMNLRERTISREAHRALIEAAGLVSGKETEEVERLVSIALTPQFAVEMPVGREQQRRVAKLKRAVQEKLPESPANALTPSQAHDGAHLFDEASYERLARLLADCESYFNLSLEHPLSQGTYIEVDKSGMMPPLRQHFTNWHDILTAQITKTMLPLSQRLAESIAQLKDAQILTANYTRPKSPTPKGDAAHKLGTREPEDTPRSQPIRILQSKTNKP